MKKVTQSYWRTKPSKVPIWKQKNDDEKLGGTAEYHESRLKQLFPKMEKEDAKKLGKELAE
jgi:hypothetical protein